MDGSLSSARAARRWHWRRRDMVADGAGGRAPLADGRVADRADHTSGDRSRTARWPRSAARRSWTKELDQALLDDETDVSVHSMKDVESERPASSRIAAMLPRADVRDRLIGADSIERLPQGRPGRHLLAAPGRAVAACPPRPRDRSDPRQCRYAPRQGRSAARSTRPCSPPPDWTGSGLQAGIAGAGRGHAAGGGQGAIGIECRADDVDTRAELLQRSTMRRRTPRSRAERAFAGRSAAAAIRRSAPLAPCWSTDRICLRAELLTEDGTDRVADDARFAVGDEQTPAEPRPRDARPGAGLDPRSVRGRMRPLVILRPEPGASRTAARAEASASSCG